MKIHMEKAVEDAFRQEIAFCFCNVSREIEHKGGHAKAAHIVVKRIHELVQFYNEVVKVMNGWSD